MKEEKDSWEELIRAKIYEYESDTDPGDWDLIAARLPAGKAVSLRPYRRYGYIAAAAVAALLIVGGIYFYPHSDNASTEMAFVETPDDQSVIVEQSTPPVDDAAGIVEQSTESIDKTAADREKRHEPGENGVKKTTTPLRKVSVTEQKTHTAAVLRTTDASSDAELLAFDKIETEVDRIPEPSIRAIEEAMIAGVDKISSESVSWEESLLAQAQAPDLSEASVGKKARRWGFGMGGGGYAMNSSSGALGFQSKSSTLNDDTYLFNTDNMRLRNSTQGETLAEIIKRNETNAGDRALGEVKHKMPISAGLGVSYYINDRWSIQSGAVYTLLRSKGSYNDRSANFIKWKQNLHYIGVPLSATYKIAEWNRLQLYATGGGMCEFNVSGRLKQTVYGENRNINESENQRMKTPLWSVNARGGVSYPLWRFLHVYAEAGASYYFDNHSEIETIRSDKPFNVSLQAGFRLGF